MSASACQRPRKIACCQASWSMVRSFLATRSAMTRTMATPDNMAAVIHRLRNPLRMASSSSSPRRAMGKGPTMTIQPIRTSGSL